MYAAVNGNLNLVKSLIDAGAALDSQEKRNGRTALIFAAWNGHHQCVDSLIEAGADVNIVSESGCTALAGYKWGLTEEGHYKCIESLIAAGTDVNVSDFKGRNSGYIALVRALPQHDVTKIRLYLKAGVYINDTEICGHSALEELIEERKKGAEEKDTFEQMALLLHAAGAKISDATDNIPEYLQPTICLKDICRRAIRNHLIKMDPKHHLFKRIPQLKLPDLVKSYLLYDMSLETRREQQVDDLLMITANDAAAKENDK